MPILSSELAITDCGETRYNHQHVVPILIEWSQPLHGWSLDLGCGFGNTTETISKSTKGDVVGLEVVSTYIKFRRLPNLHYIVADANHLPFQDKVFKTIFCIGVLHHIQRIQQTLTEISRTLSGSLIGLEPNAISPSFSSIWGLRKIADIFLGTGERPIDPRWFTTYLESKGFKMTHLTTNLGLKNLGLPFTLLVSPQISSQLFNALSKFDKLIPTMARATFIFKFSKE